MRRAGAPIGASARMFPAMIEISRRDFMKTASAVAVTAAAPKIITAQGNGTSSSTRVFVGSGAPDGVLAYDWDPATVALAPAGVAAKIPSVDWLCFSPSK